MNRPPDRLGNLTVGDRLRAAGALQVHSGQDALGLEVSVHVIRADQLEPTLPRDRFLAQVRAAASVQHEALLPYVTGGCHEDGDTPPLLFAAARRLDARGLDEVLGRGGALDPRRVLSMGAAIGAALARLEEAGLRHGDLTPRRVRLPGRGQVVLEPIRLVPAELAPRRRRYQAPEEARGEEGTVLSDLFVLGLILVEATTGDYPIAGSGEQVAKILGSARALDFRSRLTDLPHGAADVISTLLSIAPEDRFGSAKLAAEALLAVAEGRTPPRARSRAPARPRPAAPPPVARAPLSPADLPPSTAPIPIAKPEPEPEPDSIPVAIPEPSVEEAIPTAAPLGEDRPETAPIGAIDIEAVRRQAADAITRNPGRLYVEARLGEAMLELDTDIWVGRPEGALDVQARPEAFDAAVIRVDRLPAGDELIALVPGVQVNGREVERVMLSAGDTVVAPGVDGRYERAARIAMRATGAGMGEEERKRQKNQATLLYAAAGAASLLVLVLGLTNFAAAGRTGLDAEAAAAAARAELQEATGASGEAAGPGDSDLRREDRARARYEAARNWARRNPRDVDQGREKLLAVASEYPGSGWAAVARMEADAIVRRARAAEGERLDELLAQATEDAAMGLLDDALEELRLFAQAREGTVHAERARRAMASLEGEVRARYDADMAKVQEALAKRNWAVAINVMDRVIEYVPLDLRNEALAMRDRVRNAKDELLRGSEGAPPGETSGSEGPVAVDPDKGTPPDDVEPTPPVDPEALDVAALEAFRAARNAMLGRRHLEALDGFVEFLELYSSTPTAEKYAKEVRDRLDKLLETDAAVLRLFNGQVEPLDKGRFRITYDFSDPAQLEDFRDVESFDNPPRAKWTVGRKGPSGRGSGAYVLDATFATDDLQVTYEVESSDMHDVGAIFLEPGDPQRFYLFTLRNTFFRLGVAADEEFEEHAVILFGRDMWRDTPKGQLGFVRKAGSRTPPLPVGRRHRIRSGKVGDEAWIRFPSGRTVRGSAYGDVKYEFAGLEPGLFVLGASASFPSFVVEGTPDPAWVKAQWDARLAEFE